MTAGLQGLLPEFGAPTGFGERLPVLRESAENPWMASWAKPRVLLSLLGSKVFRCR